MNPADIREAAAFYRSAALCGETITGHEYDEAFSISSAFSAAKPLTMTTCFSCQAANELAAGKCRSCGKCLRCGGVGRLVPRTQMPPTSDELRQLCTMPCPSCHAEPCSGLAATWCPIHGDCICHTRQDEATNWVSSMDDPRCPLHSPESTHAEDPRETPLPSVACAVCGCINGTVDLVCGRCGKALADPREVSTQ